MDNCVFCRIVNGTNPTEILFKNEKLIAFPDLHPWAPIHILIIPKQHIRSLNDLEDGQLIVDMIAAARQVAKDQGIYDKGYNLVINTGLEGGQVIQHLHMHLLGGKRMEG
jgi:histidine triad (HIT) family protein